MVSDTMIERKKKRPFISSWLPSAILFSSVFCVGSILLVTIYKERFLGCNLYPMKVTESKICEKECRPDGTQTLPRGIVARTTDLEMRPLWGPPKKSKSPTNLLGIAVGMKQKKNVDEMVKKFLLSDFAIMLFHYDGNVDGWKDLEWSNIAVHVSAMNQTKWWFAKRFLHPDIVAAYDYIFLWDEDLGVEYFNVGRYLSIIKEEGLEISQPALDADKSENHYKLTARVINSTVHRRAVNERGPGHRCLEKSMEPPCTGFVEMMAPVFSRQSWRCAWHLIQNDHVHAWGVDFHLGYCAQGNRTENVGIVDSEYLIHLGIPTLGGSSATKTNAEIERLASMKEVPIDESDVRLAVRKESYNELHSFKIRWRKAVKEDECWTDPFH